MLSTGYHPMHATKRGGVMAPDLTDGPERESPFPAVLARFVLSFAACLRIF